MFKKKNQKDESRLPGHIAVIMDGNGRWAKAQGKPRIFGHKAGMDALNVAAVHASRRGIQAMTVYAFSTENWSRPMDEVKFIMSLPIDFYGKYLPILKAENIQIRMTGEREAMPKATLEAIDRAMEETKMNDGMILNFAMNYGGRRELVLAMQAIAASGVPVEEITEELISQHLQTAFLGELQDPDLVIRTSGELRLSTSLPWEAAYSELYFTETAWPDFNEAALDAALEDYAQRDRRFGGLSK